MGRGKGRFEPGLYDVLVTSGLATDLSEVDERLIEQNPLHRAEAANRIALHLSREIERAVASLPDPERVEVGVELARDVLAKIAELIPGLDLTAEMPVAPGGVLRSITSLLPDGSPRAIDSPLIPLLDTTLLTNAPGEPRVGHQIATEIGSAERIDVLMAFVRLSGIRPLVAALKRHCQSGGSVRVLTTTYTGSTQQEALDLLRQIGADVRVSYDLTTTRLHAKAWMFHRPTGFSTAYIGSSNLTHSAQVSGLEWNVRVSGARNPDVIEKVRAVFETYWESDDFVPYDPDEFSQHLAETKRQGPRIYLSPVAISAMPFQERLLEEIAISRERGHHRNLLVAATGTGKTVMAALDYIRLRKTLGRSRLLFVAHRKEILDQSQATFCHALRDPSFGEQWVGGRRPAAFDHVFASIQSINSTDLEHLPPDHFDVVIVDEFHHAAASSYERLLNHVRPKELLGLTATPERSDGLPILHWFDDRIAAELRLWDAIDQHHLTPFTYYGIHDGMDLRDIPWRRGSYAADALSAAYTGSDSWTHQVIKEFATRVDDLSTVRALGFCVSIEHARHMATAFNEAGINATAIWGDSPELERVAALRALADGKVRIVFSVDLFNEGIDVPAVDTLLMLRPTDSPVLFLQQLGRGLRRDDDKAICTVLDFVGHHRREFRFDRRLRALLGGTRKDVEEQVAGGFPYLPAGCHMELDHKASEIVLASIRSAVPSRWSHKAEELRTMVAAGHEPTLATYLDHTGLDLEDVLGGGRGWSDLRQAADLPVLPAGPQETALRRGAARLVHVDDADRLDGYRTLLGDPTTDTPPPNLAELRPEHQRLARMLVSQLVDQVPRSDLGKEATAQEGFDLLWSHPQVRSEILELLDVLQDRTTHLVRPLPGRPDVPLQIHARYTRLEILSAFGDGDGARTAAWQTGCRWLPAAGTDLFAFTLDKTAGSFSPTTRYKDYAISPDLIHWESQTVTRESSDTGLRYQHHASTGSDIIMFARLRQDDRAFWCLGPATYVRHEGERPMAITWRLDIPLPGDLFTKFAAAVA